MLFVAPRIAFQIWFKGFGAMRHNGGNKKRKGLETASLSNDTALVNSQHTRITDNTLLFFIACYAFGFCLLTFKKTKYNEYK